MTFDVTTPGSPWPSAPADGFLYSIDPTTFAVDVNSAVLGMVSAGESLLLIDGFPVSDRLHINVAGLDSGLSMGYEVGFTGPTFSSLDITEQYGLYDFATLTSYNWIINGSGVGAMFIDFSDVEIIAPDFGIPYCYGDGSGLACPCGNLGPVGAGCGNSAGTGGILTSDGSASVSADDAEFSVSGLPTGVSALLFAGTVDLGPGALFGDGIRCAGGQLKRLGVESINGMGEATWPTGLSTLGSWTAGDRRFIQVWYRDPSSLCGTQFNVSSALDVTFDV
jgi:hypothetical protein